MFLPGTRSTEAVRDDGQTDFLGTLWAPVARLLAPVRHAGDLVAEDELPLASGRLVVRYVRHPRARRYRLLFRRDGSARCTVPLRGTLREARRFVASNERWLAARLQGFLETPRPDHPLRPGDPVALRGVETPLTASGVSRGIHLGSIDIEVPPETEDLRPAVETALRREAAGTLPGRVRELAAAQGLTNLLARVSIRNQRTRWGSCSARGVVSLNWRLIQVPPAVCDYVILHELAHLVHLNHSARFWELVERMCPNYRESEQWLKRTGRCVL